MSDIAYKYNEARNKDGMFFPGVPLADITQEEFRALPEWMQAQVKASQWYSPAGAALKKKAPAKKKSKKVVVAKPQVAMIAPVVAETPDKGKE